MYYLLLRISASFTIDRFSKWSGIILNIIIFTVSNVLVFKIAKELSKSSIYGIIGCVINGFSLIALNSNSYIRMYELANLMTLFLTWFHLKIYHKESISWRETLPIAISFILGGLTHYYVLVYGLGLYIVYTIKCIKNKEKNNLFKYQIAIVGSAICFLAIFPYAIYLVFLSECDEVGLGLSRTRKGRPISNSVAKDILELFKAIPQVGQYGFKHFEQIQLLVDQISKDRVSDIACSLIKSFLIDYTIDQCTKYGIPLQSVEVFRYDYKQGMVIKEGVKLPMNEESKQPILFVPKRWLRYTPWLNYDDYFNNYLIKDIEKEYDGTKNRIEVLKYNSENFGMVERYISLKEADRGNCENDPLFSRISVNSARRKVSEIKSLPTGKTDNADKRSSSSTCSTDRSLGE